MNLQLTGRHAFVVASTGGLGLAVAKALAEEGANVVLSGRRGELARTEAKQLPAAIGVEMNIRNPDDQRRALDAAEDQFGPVDIVVLNGGGPLPGLAMGVTSDALQDAVDLLLLSHQRFTDMVISGMMARRWGRVLGIGSSAVQEPIEGLALSNIVRPALAGYLKTLAREVAPHGVTVNMILPGRIQTGRIEQLDSASATRQGTTVEQVRAASEARIPVGRYGSPEEFGAVAAFLCSEQAGYVTGSQIRVDGGMAAGW